MRFRGDIVYTLYALLNTHSPSFSLSLSHTHTSMALLLLVQTHFVQLKHKLLAFVDSVTFMGFRVSLIVLVYPSHKLVETSLLEDAKHACSWVIRILGLLRSFGFISSCT